MKYGIWPRTIWQKHVGIRIYAFATRFTTTTSNYRSDHIRLGAFLLKSNSSYTCMRVHLLFRMLVATVSKAVLFVSSESQVDNNK